MPDKIACRWVRRLTARPMANSATPDAAMLKAKARRPPPSTRKGKRGTMAPTENADIEPRPAATGEPIVAAERPISSRTNVSIAFSGSFTVSYTHLRAHETVLDLVCRLLL